MSSAEAEVIAANQAFYDAFAQGDLLALEELWAEEAPVACIHPGWDALEGRSEVMASWRAILTGGPPTPVQCSNARAHVLGETAYVICEETLPSAELVATNVFVREGGRWRMVHHQAGPIHRRVPRRAPKAPKTSGVLN